MTVEILWTLVVIGACLLTAALVAHLMRREFERTAEEYREGRLSLMSQVEYLQQVSAELGKDLSAMRRAGFHMAPEDEEFEPYALTNEHEREVYEQRQKTAERGTEWQL